MKNALTPRAICLAMGSASSSGIGPSLDAIRQRWPFDEFQHKRTGAVRFFQAIDSSDVRMVQRRQNLGFALKTSEAIRISGERLGQHLERLCLPKTSSPHYVHWALLRISRRPASITGHADRLSRTVHRVGLRPAEPGGAPD